MSISTSDREREWQLRSANLGPVRRWLQEHPRLADLRIQPRSTVALHDRYLDTGDWSILRAGFALRLRHHDKGSEATLKSLEKPRDGFVDRLESSQPLESAAVESLATGEGPVASKVQSLAGAAPLGILFEAWTRRERYAVLAADEPVAEIALDESTLGSPDGADATVLTRVEIEAQGKGHPELPTLVARLRSECELEPAAVTKFEAGLEAAGLTPVAEAPPAPHEPTAGMPAAEAATLILTGQLDAFRKLETGIRLGDDAEALHEFRVAVRRMLVSLKAYDRHLPAGIARTAPTLRKVFRALGAVRDYDVQLADVDAFAAELDDAHREHLEPLRARLRQERTRARARLLKALDEKTTREALARLAEILRSHAPGRARPQSLAAAVPAIAQRSYRKLRKAAAQVSDGASAETMHEARVVAKKMRYSIEPFAGLYGEPAKDFLKALHRLQDVLGEHQDRHEMAQRLHALADSNRRRLPGQTLFLMGQLAERASRDVMRSRKGFAKALRRVRGKRWKRLRGTMHALEVTQPQA